ncbi:hypothetical protein C9426_09370 [Serratia sp. S1B]|nr:hypothetical protein C9426_09370 [Serratia sp. S1B]
MNKNLLLLIILIFSPYYGKAQQINPPSKEQSENFLNDITKNIKVSIDDMTKIRKSATTKNLLISTRYPLPQDKVTEYKMNNGTITNTDHDISDYASYIFKNYELVNEKNENLQMVDDNRAIYLQEFSLSEKDSNIYQDVGIPVKLNKEYSKLTGSITIEFTMPDEIKKEVKIPVDIILSNSNPQ